jgi:hypothetical protein
MLLLHRPLREALAIRRYVPRIAVWRVVRVGASAATTPFLILIAYRQSIAFYCPSPPQHLTMTMTLTSPTARMPELHDEHHPPLASR